MVHTLPQEQSVSIQLVHTLPQIHGACCLCIHTAGAHIASNTWCMLPQVQSVSMQWCTDHTRKNTTDPNRVASSTVCICVDHARIKSTLHGPCKRMTGPNDIASNTVSTCMDHTKIRQTLVVLPQIWYLCGPRKNKTDYIQYLYRPHKNYTDYIQYLYGPCEK